MLFDMDDTIVTDDAVSEFAWKEVCRICSETTRLSKSEELFTSINEIREWFWGDFERAQEGRLNLHQARRTIVKKALERLGYNDEEVVSQIVNNYVDLKDRVIGLFPNTEGTLRELVRRGIKLALLTNGEGNIQRRKIERFNLDQYFTVCLIEGELGYGKPDPRMYETALDKLETTAEQTWMVGDDLERDIAGAQRLGIFSIWHDYSKKWLADDSRVKPDRIVNNISEVLSLL